MSTGTRTSVALWEGSVCTDKVKVTFSREGKEMLRG
jgi:hypothetical protein